MRTLQWVRIGLTTIVLLETITFSNITKAFQVVYQVLELFNVDVYYVNGRGRHLHDNVIEKLKTKPFTDCCIDKRDLVILGSRT